MFKFTVEGNTLLEAAQNARELADALRTLAPVATDKFGYEKNTTDPSVTVPHIFPVPRTPLGSIDAQAAHDKMEEAHDEIEEKSIENETAFESIAKITSVDSKGMPWDERIHASSRAVTKDGTWRYRRGVEEADITVVEAELRGATPKSDVSQALPSIPVMTSPSIPTPTVSSQTAPAPTQSPVMASPVSLPPMPTPPSPTVAVDPIPQPVSAPVAAPAVMAPVVAPPSYDNIPAPASTVQKPAHSYETFKATFIPTVADLVGRKVLTPEYIAQLVEYFSVPEIWKVREDDKKCHEMFESLVQYGYITKVG